jgi:hypothetical protein
VFHLILFIIISVCTIILAFWLFSPSKEFIIKKQLYFDGENKYYVSLWTEYIAGDDFMSPHTWLKIKIYNSNKNQIWFNYDYVNDWEGKYETYIKKNFEDLNNRMHKCCQNQKAIDDLKWNYTI